jgi:glucuronoxylan 4-O-methyltransferase
MRTLNRIWLLPSELQVIAREVLRRAPCRMLVFGAGNDSVFWAALNVGGETVILEDTAEWVRRVAAIAPTLTLRSVSYTSRRAEWRRMLGTYADRAMALPGDVRARAWDVILVDGPRGSDDQSPGRMQSITAASALIAEGGSVLVHDCNRPVERAYCDYYLGGAELVFRSWRLRHYQLTSTAPVNLACRTAPIMRP